MTDYTVLQKEDGKFVCVTCPECRRMYSSGLLLLTGAELGCPYCRKNMSPMEWLGFREADA
jgi:hypothetical protein